MRREKPAIHRLPKKVDSLLGHPSTDFSELLIGFHFRVDCFNVTHGAS